MASEFTTTEVAKRLGIQPALLRKWKARGLLKLAPPGVSGQGRSVECYWSEAAIEEVKALQASRLKRSNMTAKDGEIAYLRSENAALKERVAGLEGALREARSLVETHVILDTRQWGTSAKRGLLDRIDAALSAPDTTKEGG